MAIGGRGELQLGPCGEVAKGRGCGAAPDLPLQALLRGGPRALRRAAVAPPGRRTGFLGLPPLHHLGRR